LFISPLSLVDDGWLGREDLPTASRLPPDRVDHALAISERSALLDKAYRRFQERPEPDDYRHFCESHVAWLDDFALFAALRPSFSDRAWWDWPHPLRDRQEEGLATCRKSLADAMRREKFLQYLFFRQWFRLKRYANERGIQFVGDIPFYMAHDSTDVWVRPEIFKLTTDKRPRAVAGVPPDRFSDTGQLWGSPVYDWQRLKDLGYDWWIARIRHNIALFDIIRIDHFRGFAACWEVPAGSDSAAPGKWAESPGEDFLRHLFRRLPFAPVIAEDLGTITPEVRELIRKFDLPGMRVLQFAFDDDSATNPHSLHNHEPNSVLYTGTHDNSTLRGWFENEADERQKKRLFEYLGRSLSPADVHRNLIRLAMMSVSNLVIIPMQDALGLGDEARMNRPATVGGNWGWRMKPGLASDEIARELSRLSGTFGRAG
jgi:4-alpha-glucanotransferase